MDETLNKFKKEIEEEYAKKYQLMMSMLYEKSPEDLFIFNKHVLQVESGDDKFVPLGKFHKDLCRFVTDRKDKKKLILIPRGHLKTKLITIGYTLQQICKNPKVRILIYSATWQMAVDIVSNIQKQLQGSERLIELFGNLSMGATEWSQDRFRLRDNDKREPTVTAAGIDNNLVGGHYDLIILDDVVNRENVNTQDQIGKVINKYKDCLDLLEPSGQLIVVGTRWHDSDLYGWIMDPSNDVLQSYNVMVKKAYEGNIDGEDFVPLWPEKFSRDELKSRLREEGWSHFSAQYLNDPVPEQDAKFRRDWFQYYDEWDVKGRVLNRFLAIDPALTLNKDSDYSAMVVVGIDEWGQIFILDIVRLRLSPNDLINEIFRLREKWGLNDIGIELVAFQKTIAYSLREDDRFKRHPFHITELKTNERSKEQRILGLQPLYENAKIFHNKYLTNNVYLEDELVRFPRSTHDDIIDALSYCLDFIFPSRQSKKNKSSKRTYLY